VGRAEDLGPVTQALAGRAMPGDRTVHAVLDRHGLVSRRGRGPRRRRAESTPLTTPEQPNALWCTDACDRLFVDLEPAIGLEPMTC